MLHSCSLTLSVLLLNLSDVYPHLSIIIAVVSDLEFQACGTAVMCYRKGEH